MNFEIVLDVLISAGFGATVGHQEAAVFDQLMYGRIRILPKNMRQTLSNEEIAMLAESQDENFNMLKKLRTTLAVGVIGLLVYSVIHDQTATASFCTSLLLIKGIASHYKRESLRNAE